MPDQTPAVEDLIELSFADGISLIEAADDLPLEKRRRWTCSMRVGAAMLGKPEALIAARWTAVRGPLSRLHPTARGVSHKTLANHKANVRAALTWLAKTEAIPSRGSPLSPDWALVRNRIPHYRTRAILSSPMRFWSARGVGPYQVTEPALDAYMQYRAETTSLAADSAARRRIARAWNQYAGAVDGWPAQKLPEPLCKQAATGPAWEEFPVSLRRDIEAYLSGLLKIRKAASGRRWKPCASSTIKMRRARLCAFVRKAVTLGAPLETLGSLPVLLHPDTAERVLNAYWEERGDVPSIYTIELAAMLVDVARRIDGVDAAVLARLVEMRGLLEQHRSVGMTSKNMTLIRQVLTPGVWARVVSLPEQMMQEARSRRQHSPVKAAVIAQIASAIGILTIAPVRLGNLAAITLDQHLVRPGGGNSPYWLVFPDHDVKNRVRLEFPLDPELSALLDEYLLNHLPVLERSSKQLRLFPGANGKQKVRATLSTQISERIRRETGLRMTVHQFRHAAAAIILQAHPGNYEFVRRILGHKNIQTTIQFYTGLETTQAARLFGEIVRKNINFEAAV